jgi:glutaredoxin
MKNIIIVCIAGLFVLSAFGAAAQPSDVKTQNGTNQGSKVFTHTVFAEDGTATWCGYCHYAREALDKIFTSGDYPFYYVCMVDDMNAKAAQRNTEYNVYGFPTVWFDGGYKVNVGGGTGNEAQYRSSINTCGARTVANIDINLNVTWLGNAAMNITASVMNNEAAQYAGHLRIYVTEVESSLGWHDTAGHPYTFPFLEYAYNGPVTIPSGDTWTNTMNWDGHNYQNGYGVYYGNIQYGNIMVIAVMFNNTWHQGYSYPPSSNPFNAYYVDDAAGFWVGDNRPPNVPSNPSPANGATSVDITKDLSWVGGDPDPTHDHVTYDVYFGTTSPPPLVSSDQTGLTYDTGTMAYSTKYYWQIIATDNHGASADGPIWSFTTMGNPNHPPMTPEITGPSPGKVKTTLTYVLNAIDPDSGDQLYYFVDWGDNTTTDWTGPYASGVDVSLTHSWNTKASYTIKAKVKDQHGAESDWGTLTITIPVNYIPHGTLLELLQKILARFPLLEQLLNR